VFLSGGITILLLSQFRSIAVRVGLVDLPGDRKIHDYPIPVIGGICMALGFLLALSLSSLPVRNYQLMLFSTAVIVIVGVLDDFNDISATKKFLFQFLVAAAVVLVGNQSIHSLGEILFVAKPYGLGPFAYPFSILAFIGVMNAFNMIDGHDGLAGGISVIGFASLAMLCALGGEYEIAKILMLLISAILGFLIFNIPLFVNTKKKVFMGDAGSMFIGLLMAFFAIDLARNEHHILKVAAAPWIVGIPLLDLFGVIILRSLKKQSLFAADRLHIHHLLIGLGLSKHVVLGILLVAQAFCCGIGIFATLYMWNDGILFWALFVLLGVYLWLRHVVENRITKQHNEFSRHKL
jgi:UDP-GlcNAc:undecaprenyl-phosphate GlcNAc-1-phosphate transferase